MVRYTTTYINNFLDPSWFFSKEHTIRQGICSWEWTRVRFLSLHLWEGGGEVDLHLLHLGMILIFKSLLIFFFPSFILFFPFLILPSRERELVLVSWVGYFVQTCRTKGRMRGAVHSFACLHNLCPSRWSGWWGPSDGLSKPHGICSVDQLTRVWPGS